MTMDYFGNDKYRVLRCMADRQVAVGEVEVVKLSQEEIATIINLSKRKVNALIKDLKNDGYITQVSSRGQYTITEKAKKELPDFEGKEVSQ